MERVTILTLILFFCIGVSAMSSGQQEEAEPEGEAAETGTTYEVMGDNFTYDPNVKVNNGKKLTLTYWGASNWENYYKKWTSEYSKIHPNVNWELNFASYGDHRNKLPLALASGTGPDIFFFHNSYVYWGMENFEPWPKDQFPLKELKEDFKGVEPVLFEDDTLYYMDLGFMTPVIAYNKDLWAEAGLTKEDIPQTWDELIEVAKKLTETDGSGKITQTGFSYNSAHYIWSTLMYQQGTYMFKEDGVTPEFDTAEGKKALTWMRDAYKEHKVGDVNRPANYEDFANGNAGMIFVWGWVNLYLKQNFPDLNYGAFPVPTWTKDTPPARNRTNQDSSPAVSPHASETNKEAAFNFIRYMLTNNDMLLEFDEIGGMAPSKKGLADNPRIKNDPILGSESAVVDRSLWPGPVPSFLWQHVQAYMYDGVLIEGMDITKALQEAEDAVKTDLADVEYKSREPLYRHAEEMSFPE